MDDLPAVQRIDVLRLQPGDVLAVIPGRPLDWQDRTYVHEMVSAAVPGHKVIVLDVGTELAVARPAEIS